MADAKSISFYAGAAVVTDGSGDVVDLTALHTLVKGSVRVGSFVGALEAPLTFTLETSPDGSSDWRAAARFQLLGVGVKDFVVDSLERFCRVSYELGGASQLSFSMSGEAHVLYATRQDLRVKSLSEDVTDFADDGVLAESLLSATDDAENALNAQYTLPITTWPESLRRRCASIAKYYFLGRDGFQPQGVDELIVKDHDDAQKWLKEVAARKIVLSGVAEKTYSPVQYSFSRDEPCPPRRYSDDWGDF
jgi:phage gp36-like protein